MNVSCSVKGNVNFKYHIHVKINNKQTNYYFNNNYLISAINFCHKSLLHCDHMLTLLLLLTTVEALLATALESDQALVTTTTVKPRLNCHSNSVIKSSHKRPRPASVSDRDRF